MTREQLIDSIMGSDEAWTCARNNCNGESCESCVEEQVAEYEARIRSDAISEILIPYDAESIEELVGNISAKARVDAIDECIDKLCFSTILSYRSDDIRRILEQLKEQKSCADCILDQTDACTRGAGRAVDDEICGAFLEEEYKDETSV